MEAWIHFNESVRNSVWISCALKKIFQCACSFPRLHYLRDYRVLPLLIANPWICHSQFYVLYWHSSSLLYRFVVCFLVCHVYLRVTMTSSTRQNNRLFALCTDMDWALLCLSHMQRGTFYVQICDNKWLTMFFKTRWRFSVISHRRAKPLRWEMTEKCPRVLKNILQGSTIHTSSH